MSDIDVITQFCDAMQAGDVDAVIATMAPDAELISPLAGRGTFRGRDDLRVVISALLPAMPGLTWRHRVSSPGITVAVADARVLGVRIGDAMVIEHDDGGIRRLSPHIRPWLGLTMMVFALAPKLVRHPAVIRRSLRRN